MCRQLHVPYEVNGSRERARDVAEAIVFITDQLYDREPPPEALQPFWLGDTPDKPFSLSVPFDREGKHGALVYTIRCEYVLREKEASVAAEE